jgi:hypothetical protein
MPTAPANPSPAAPRQVLLFSGHMVDAPDRSVARFPASKVDAAAARIAGVLRELDAGPADLALTQGAAGGDLLFSEACLARRVPLRWLLPLPEAAFVEQSVLASADGAAWRERFDAARARLAVPPRSADAEFGALRPGADPFERGNRWLLDTALGFGAERLRAIVLWDGGGGDGPGGTRHMVDEVRRRGGQVHWIDARGL